MQRLEGTLMRGIAFATMLVLVACATTEREKQLLVVDKGSELRNPAFQEDRLRVNLSIQTKTTLRGRTTQGLNYELLTGPYFLYVEIGDGRPRGMIAAIDVREAVLEIRYADANVQRIELSTAPSDWRRYGQEGGYFVLGLPATPQLDVDFWRLQEIKFFLRFVGVFPNGERREYWVEQYAKPRAVHEKENDLWEAFIRLTLRGTDDDKAAKGYREVPHRLGQALSFRVRQ